MKKVVPLVLRNIDGKMFKQCIIEGYIALCKYSRNTLYMCVYIHAVRGTITLLLQPAHTAAQTHPVTQCTYLPPLFRDSSRLIDWQFSDFIIHHHPAAEFRWQFVHPLRLDICAHTQTHTRARALDYV